jgi:outer membrane protein assembly factor BamD
LLKFLVTYTQDLKGDYPEKIPSDKERWGISVATPTSGIGMKSKPYIIHFGIGFTILMVTAACASRPIQPPKGRNADQLYKEGVAQLNKDNYRQAVETFYQLKYNYPAEAAAMMAELKIGDANYAGKKYMEAIENYEDFRKMHPASSYIPYAVYMIGLCYYKQMMSVDRDQTNTRRALGEFQYLLAHFSNTPYAYDAYQKAEECMKQLSEHEVYIGNFYFKSKQYEAAVQRYETALTHYASVPLEPEVLFRLADAYRRIDQPEKAQKTYTVIIEQYPDSGYAEKSRDRLDEISPASAGASSTEDGKTTSSAAPPPGDAPRGVTVAAFAGTTFITKSQSGLSADPIAVNPPGLNPSSTPPRTFAVLHTSERSASKTSPIEERTLTDDAPPGSATEAARTTADPGPAAAELAVAAPRSPENRPQSMKAAADGPSDAGRGPAAVPSDIRPANPTGATESIEEDSDAPAMAQNEPESPSAQGPSAPERASPAAVGNESGSETAESPLETAGRPETKGSKKELGFGELSGDLPINITADRMDAFQKEDRVVFEGNVVVHQKNTFIYAQHITAEMAPDNQGGGIRRVIALQDVRITENDRVATCDRAEFDNITRIIELSGNPKIWRGQDRIYGDKVVVNLNSDKMTVLGSDDKRVSAVLYPKSAEGKPKTPKADKDTTPRPSLTVPFAGPENADLKDAKTESTHR